MPDGKVIGERIRKNRMKLKLTQEQLAEKVNVKPSAISMYEVGERMPRDETKKKLAILFGTTIDELFF